MALIQYHGINVITAGVAGGGDAVRIMPGVNQLDDDVLKKLKTHPSFAARVRDGKIQILDDVKTTKDGKTTVEEMLRLIPKMFDTKLLKKIMKEDGRSEVVEAARDQMAVIMGTKKPEENQGTENEHFS